MRRNFSGTTYSDKNPAFDRMHRSRDQYVARERAAREQETDTARKIRAMSPGMSWGAALRAAAQELNGGASC